MRKKMKKKKKKKNKNVAGALAILMKDRIYVDETVANIDPRLSLYGSNNVALGPGTSF
jgi:hypothetical protein